MKLKKVASSEDLPFGERTTTYNSRLAQELGKWAEEEDRSDEFHQAMFRAYFADGKNIADEGVLLDVAASVSLDVVEAKRILGDRVFKDAVDNDWQRAFDLGITAVPTFLIDIRRLVGAQTYEVLERFILSKDEHSSTSSNRKIFLT